MPVLVIVNRTRGSAHARSLWLGLARGGGDHRDGGSLTVSAEFESDEQSDDSAGNRLRHSGEMSEQHRAATPLAARLVSIDRIAP